MKLTQKSIQSPTAVAVVAAVILLLGFVTIFRLPVQLFPDIENPQIAIQTTWRAAAPNEMESEIVKPIEEVMQGIPGLEELNAWSNQGGSWINMEFALEADMDMVMLEVISRLNRLPPLPAPSV